MANWFVSWDVSLVLTFLASVEFAKVSSYFLKYQNETIQRRLCLKHHDLEVYHTLDKKKVMYIADGDVLVDTPESRILMHPQNAEEIEVQAYFLEKKFPFLEYFLDDTVFVERLLNKLSGHAYGQWKRILRHVVVWMSEHKYLETDPRVFAKVAELPRDRYYQRVLYRQFPVPVLKSFHPIVQEACEKGLLYCLKLVHEYAVAHVQQFNKHLNSPDGDFTSMYWQLRYKKKHDAQITEDALNYGKKSFCAMQGDTGWTWFAGQQYEPFLSRNDLFEFRATASYYLCNYTMTQRQLYGHLAYPGSPETYHAWPGSGRYKALECAFNGPIPGGEFSVYRRSNLSFTMATLDGFPCNFVGSCHVPLKGKVGQKHYDDEFYWDFSCVMLAFCPDVCCGAYKNPLQDPTDIERCTKTDKDYPCRDGAQNDDCDYNTNTNANFFDLIQNRINMTCGCNEKEGKQWDSALATCLDIDECVEANPCNRESEICINRLTGLKPLCVCEFGYYRANGTGQCVVDPNSGLFQNIDEAELRMKQLYGPIEEGKTPNLTQGGSEADALKMALGNVGNLLGKKNSAASLLLICDFCILQKLLNLHVLLLFSLILHTSNVLRSTLDCKRD